MRTRTFLRALLCATVLHGAGAPVQAQDQDPVAFYRFVSPTQSQITALSPDRTIVWSNAAVSITGRFQRATMLTGYDIWTDCVQCVVTGTWMTLDLPAPPCSGLVLIPGGANTGVDPDFGAYSLTVSAFTMDKDEVTKALWDDVYVWAVTNGYGFDNVGSGKEVNHPVHSVNWYDVVKWCNARSEMEGRPAAYTVDGDVYRNGQSNDVVQTSVAGYRLPTDEEWRYAARGGVSSRRFPWGDSDNIQHARANYYSSGAESYDTSPTQSWHPDYDDGVLPVTAPVGSFAPNGYGLTDMAGNVGEWCFDWHPDFERKYRVFRGGSWGDGAEYCRIGFRNGFYPNYNDNRIGFRTVLPSGQ